ncbi:hypothetical protein C8R43DRAFT_1046827 [Mycena crocata]|nr:hypothetical protein C8R43DRAFT_1046827 [Mycena crocata]
MASPQSLKLVNAGTTVMYHIFGLVVQTFFFGVYTILIWLSTRMLLQRKLTSTVNKVLFGVTTFMYLLSACYWAYSVADGVDRMYHYIALAENPSSFVPDHTSVTQWSPLFNAVTLINYVLSDAVVVWRAWVICLRNHRKYLSVAIVFLVLTVVTVTLTIGIRIANLIQSPIANLPKGTFLDRAIDILQIATLGTSLLSNLTATGVVGVTARQHWRTIRAAFSEKKNASTNNILLLVVESGVFYCISAITVLLASLIRLPHGTLGDLYTPVNVQIAGAYPTIVLLLVGRQRSLSEPTFADDTYLGSTPEHSMKFGTPGPNSTVTPISIHFARNPAMSIASTETMDISPQPGEKRLNRLSDDSFV